MTLAFFVLTQYRLVTDRQTGRHITIAITKESYIIAILYRTPC